MNRPSTSPCIAPFFTSLQSRKGILIFCLGLLAVASAHAQSGLVAHYAFNGTFTDQTANGNHALPSGNPGFVPDRNGAANRAIALGGCAAPQFLRVPNSASLEISEALTVAFWAKIDLSSGMDPGTGTCNANGRQVFFAKGGDGYGGSPPGLQGLTYTENSQQNISFESSTNSGQARATASRAEPGVVWHYYTYMISRTEVRIYVDAQLLDSFPVSVNFLETNQQDLYLGAMGPKSSPVLGITNWYPFKGALDDVRIYNRQLSAQEVSTLFLSDDSGTCSPMVSILPAGPISLCEGQTSTLRASPLADAQLQWLKEGQPLAQATLDSLVVTQPGTYQLQATRRTETWKNVIKGPQNSLNDVHFADGTNGWIVGDYGTLLKSTNGGTSWDTIPTHRTDRLTSVYFVTAQLGYIGGANGLLLKSTDGGVSLVQQYLPTSETVWQIQFLNEQAGYAQAGNALFKTTNGGATWTAITMPDVSSKVGSFSFVDPQYGWVSSNKKIYKTENGGASWTEQYTLNTYSTFGRIFALDRDRVWGSCTSEGQPSSVIRTTDGGISWGKFDFRIPDSYAYSYFSVNDLRFIDSQTGYAIGNMYRRVFAMYGINSGAAFQTKDGGQTWSLIYNNPFYANPLSISFAGDAQGTLVGSAGLIIRVQSSGSASTEYPERTFLPLNSVGSTSTNVYAVGGKFRGFEAGPHPDSKAVTLTFSPDGEQFKKTETGSQGGGGGYTLKQIKFKNDQFGWRAGYSSLATTHDGGNTWKSLLKPGPPTEFDYIIEKAYFTGDTTGFYLIQSANGAGSIGLNGFSGTTRTFPNPSYKDSGDPYSTGMLDLQFIDDNTGFITTSNGKLIKTTDAGATWSIHLVRPNARLERCYFVTAQLGWVVGENGLIMKTTDGGTTWTEQTSGLSTHWRGIWFLSATEGYLVGDGGTLVKTNDGGTSWVKIEVNTHSTLNDITFTTRDKGYIVGDQGTVLAFNPTLLPECKASSNEVAVLPSSGEVCTSTGSGTWGNISTWSCGHVPRSCDQIVVDAGHVITLTESVQVRTIEVRQNGQLAMQGGSVLIQQ